VESVRGSRQRARTVKNTIYRQIEERAKLAEELPEIAPFDDAVKLITREATKKQPRKKRERENFLTFLLGIRGIVRRFALPTGLVELNRVIGGMRAACSPQSTCLWSDGG
jgi:hypothetical protein